MRSYVKAWRGIGAPQIHHVEFFDLTSPDSARAALGRVAQWARDNDCKFIAAERRCPGIPDHIPIVGESLEPELPS